MLRRPVEVAANSCHSLENNERQVNTENGHPEAIWRSAGTDPLLTDPNLNARRPA
jgi:hypothetical protein